MAKKKNIKSDEIEEVVDKKKVGKDLSGDEEAVTTEDGILDPAVIEDTFTEEFSEYNDVDNF